MRSLDGYPVHFADSKPYRGMDVLLVNGDIVIDRDIQMIHGTPALGQKMVMSMLRMTEDLYAGVDPEQLTSEPWRQRENLKGVSFEERIRRAVSQQSITSYVDSILDVRTNGKDVEIDYKPNGDRVQVLLVEGLVPGPDGKKRTLLHGPPTPLSRDSIITVEDLNHRLVAYLQEHPSNVQQLPWRTFERLVAELLDNLGWDILELTRGSKDRGVDIYAAMPIDDNLSVLTVIDVKQYTNRIGPQWVRSIAGLKLQEKAEYGMLVTTSYFTKGARDLERKELKDHVKLEDLDTVLKWLAGHKWKKNGGLYLPESRFSAGSD